MKKSIVSHLSLIFTASILFFSACESTKVENNSIKPEDSDSTTQAPVISKKSDFENMQIELVSKSDIPTAGKAFTSPYEVSVKKNNDEPYANYALTVTYPTSKEDNIIQFSTKEIFTDENGIAKFLPDTISSSMNSVVTFAPKTNDPYQARLAKDVTLEVPLKVKFLNRKQYIMISLVDFDENDKMILSSSLSSSSNLLGEFWRAGITTSQNADFHKDLDNGAEAVVKSAKKLTQYSPIYKYVIFGKVKYAESVQNVDGGVKVSLKGTVTIADYTNNKEIATIEKITTVVEKNKWTALSSCQKQLAKDLFNELIYEM